MASSPSFCGVCSRNLDDEVLNDGEFMIQCDVCEIWYHGKCVELEEYESADIDDYHCPSCLPQAGPSKAKRVNNSHRYDYSDPDAANKPTENGTRRFIEDLQKRRFQDASDAIVVLENGHSLTSAYLDQTKFQTPIVVNTPTGLGLVVPPSSFSVDDVESHVGGDRYVDVIDVYSQHSYKMRLRTFLNFFRQENRSKLYNLISLEFSDTELSKLIRVPDVVEELSWVDQYWPKPLRDDLSSAQKAVLNEHISARPEVSKFCLIGMAKSYTDFHIDFGGTSVFYHVLWGEKVFYLIEPSEKNLRLFENWQRSPESSERFFGDLVSKCLRLELKPGQTFFIPTGWIHAVYTPTDSLVIGGNFLHSFNIGMQIRIYDMEKNINTADKFMFPHFELTNWYAGVHFLDVLKELNEEKTAAKPYLLEGLQSLVSAMKTWVQQNQGHLQRSKLSGQIIIETMTCGQVLKQLERAVRINEKLAVPSKAKRRKHSDATKGTQKTPKIHFAADSFRPTSMKLALPLPKLKLPSKYTSERSKGCPKSPAKIHQDETANSISKLPWHPEKNSAPSVKKKKKEKKEIPSSSDAAVSNVAESRSDGTSATGKSSINDPRDGNSMSTDLDSAPPTPGWTDAEISDASLHREGSSDRKLGSTQKVDSANETATSLESNSDLVDSKPAQGNSSSPEKKPFGFSLLEMRFDDVASPPTSPVEKRKDSLPRLSSPPPAPMVSPLKTAIRIKPENCDHPGLQSVSSHGRKPKPNHRAVGKKPSSGKAEFIPDLGYCRRDDEFVYPSLSDSEPSEAPIKKRRKSTETPSKKSEGPHNLKTKISITSYKKKLKAEKPKKLEKSKISVSASGGSNDVDLLTPSSAVGQGTTSTKLKKPQKGTAKQRLAKALKIRKLIPM